MPERFDRSGASLRSLFEEQYGRIFTVHRLDKQTSGAILFAKTETAHARLNEQFAKRRVEKTYRAVVSGVFQYDEIEVDIPIMPDPSRKGLMAPSARGKECLTIIKAIEKYRRASLLECRPITGRQHQIRVHLLALGSPLLVDAQYANNSEFMLSSIKRRYNTKKNEVERPIISRMSLHSYSLRFEHPSTGETVQAFAEYPKDFRALVQTLKKYSASDINM